MCHIWPKGVFISPQKQSYNGPIGPQKPPWRPSTNGNFSFLQGLTGRLSGPTGRSSMMKNMWPVSSRFLPVGFQNMMLGPKCGFTRLSLYR